MLQEVTSARDQTQDAIPHKSHSHDLLFSYSPLQHIIHELLWIIPEVQWH